MPEPESIIDQLRAQSKDAIDFFLKLGELMERDEDEPELPFYMLNRNEIFDYHGQFMERLSVKDSKIVFRTDDRSYRFDLDYLIEECGEESCNVFLEEDMWGYIYSGYFDPLPLTEKTDAWGRKVLKVHRNVPRI